MLARRFAWHRDAVRRLGLISLALSCSLACSDPPQPWTRVIHHENGNGRSYTIVQADAHDNTCTRIALVTDTEWIANQDHVEVELRGVSGFEFLTAYVAQDDPPDFVKPDIATQCTNAEPPSDIGPPPPRVSGKLRFEAPGAEGRPCRVSFDLEVWQYTDFDVETGMPTKLVAHPAFAEDVEIYDVGCPHPETTKATYTQVEAALGEFDGVSTLVMSSYDEDEGTCVWARLLPADALPSESASAVEVDGTWAYAGVRVATSVPEDCHAALLINPNVDIGPSRSAPPLRSRGTIRFTDTQSVPTSTGSVEAPCRLDLDVALETYGEFFWLPDLVRMRADAITVAGACE